MASMYTNMSVNSSSFADLPPPPNFFSNSSDFSICTNTKSFIYIFSAFSLNIIFLTPLLIFVLLPGIPKVEENRAQVPRLQVTLTTSPITPSSCSWLEYNGTAFFFIDMAANSSSNSTLHPADCLNPILVFTALYVVSILLVPLFIFVLYTGFQRRRKRGSAATTSHSDVFTFHMVVMELIGVVGDTVYCYGIYSNHTFLTNVGIKVFSVILPGQTLFHLLTCVERYLAVVHPVTYLRLRRGGGVRIRNISIGISILFVLIRPGPGEGGGNRERVDQSKQRAFYTIMAIMAALFLRFLSNLVSTSLYISSVLGDCEVNAMMWSAYWFTVPSSLVLPLLFLQRAGKLPGCKH
ncbi:hypothetical protein JOQ06_013703 [Pogonophryne albipinna]|uniref:Uncharacterized protein n=1 Tax=Pogonophryne albipinna TaxID=1090488 RepID=A0AAD6BLJ4_9TELE|nr:hypothetical protein JOQ06_013703 [Pogonophryne albipinna]